MRQPVTLLSPSLAPAPRRGVAMMLVLISLGMATILATSYLASRDNSVAIGDNIADATAAKTSAAAGLEMGVAILETATKWRVNHDNGKLVRNLAIGSATIDIDVIDMETQAPPTQETTMVQMKCTCTVNGIAQTATAMAYVPTEESIDTLSVDLAEFAVFGGAGIHLENDATITRWERAPASAARRRVAIGTRAKNAGSLSMLNNAASIDTTIFVGPGASNSLVTNGSGCDFEKTALLDDIPLPTPPAMPVAAPSGGSYPDMDDVMTLNVVANLRVEKFETAANQGKVTLADGVTLVVEKDLKLDENSWIRINGDAVIVAFEKLEMKKAAIELEDGATLTIFAAGDLKVEDSYIGNRCGTSPDRDSSGNAQWMDPARIQIYGTGDGKQWELKKNSVIKGSVYFPRGELKVEDNSAIYGRVAGSQVRLNKHAAIFYDHGLDLGCGYTNPNSAIFDDNGRILPDVLGLASLNTSALSNLANSLGTTVEILGGLLFHGGGPFGGAGGGGGGAAQPVSGQSTPRSIPVTYGMVSFGGNVFAMESAVSCGGWSAVEDDVNNQFDVLPGEKNTMVQENGASESLQ